MPNGILFLFTAVFATTWSSSLAASLTAIEKQALLDAHNAARRAVSPTASNMRVMQWDDSIAAFAQEYAERCDFDHSSSSERSSRTGFGGAWVGENLYLTTARLSGTSFRGAVDSWVAEKEYYTFATGACSRSPCGHYTQVVWDTSYRLGCGAQYCNSVASSSFTSGHIVVCQYGPGLLCTDCDQNGLSKHCVRGNFGGQQPYDSGATCSACPAAAPHCNDGLCSAQQAVTAPTTAGSTTTPGSTNIISDSSGVSSGGAAVGIGVGVTFLILCVCCPLGIIITVAVVCLCCLRKPRRARSTNASSSPPKRGRQIPMRSSGEPVPVYNPDVPPAAGYTNKPPQVSYLPNALTLHAPLTRDPVLQNSSQHPTSSKRQPAVLPYPAVSEAHNDLPPAYNSVVASAPPYPAGQGPPPSSQYHYH